MKRSLRLAGPCLFLGFAAVGFVALSNSSTDPLLRRSLSVNERREPTEMDFVRIPHTGGSVIEKAAGRAGVAWGSCHFSDKDEDYGPGCSENSVSHMEDLAAMENVLSSISLRTDVPIIDGSVPPAWQTPSHWFAPSNLYGDKIVFTVIRDPYSRMVSMYQCGEHGYQGPETEKYKPDTMNNWIVQTLSALEFQNRGRETRGEVPAYPNMAFLPQVYHVFQYTDGVIDINAPTVDHILRYDYLSLEFNRLMADYGIDNIRLDENPEEDGAVLSPSDLSDEAKQAIERFYAADFKAFHYVTFSNAGGHSGFDFGLVETIRSYISSYRSI